MKIPHIICGLISIVIGGFFYFLTFNFPELETTEVGPAFLPRVYCGLLIIFCVILFIQGLIEKGKEKTEEKTLGYALASMGIVLLYVWILPIVGFYISTLLTIFSLLLFSRVRSKLILISIPIGSVLFVFIVFEKLLKVSIPLGSLFS